jgi:hypothetical protein
MKSLFNYPNIMEPKSIEEIPSWVIVNALKCPVDAQISIVAKLLQHLDIHKRKQALRMSGVGGSLTPFGESIELLRDLADLQNGAPLEQYRQEWEETMEQVYDFLNRWEGQ